MRIAYEREIAEDIHNIISSVSINSKNHKRADVRLGDNHAKDSEKVSKIFDVLEEAKRKIEEILNESE